MSLLIVMNIILGFARSDLVFGYSDPDSGKAGTGIFILRYSRLFV